MKRTINLDLTAWPEMQAKVLRWIAELLRRHAKGEHPMIVEWAEKVCADIETGIDSSGVDDGS